jgi:hypothetical protein
MYRVMVDDNFHYMDEEERFEHGSFATAEEAIAACKRIVDEDLAQYFKPGMTGSALYEMCTSFGDDPFVVGDLDDPLIAFSAWDYGKGRANEMCTRGQK